MKPVRLMRIRRKGFKLVSPNGLPIVYVGRPTIYGNPYKIEDYNPYTCVQMYKEDLMQTPLWIRRAFLKELEGKNLSCWCMLEEWCHADVLLELANK